MNSCDKGIGAIILHLLPIDNTGIQKDVAST